VDVQTVPPPYVCTCGDANALIQIDVEGTAFLKQMVRIIVGTLITFGLDRNPLEMRDILNSRNRTKAGQTAPAAGLTLVRSFSELDDIM
jgi:tRNA pseudouridine38-40 synthase